LYELGGNREELFDLVIERWLAKRRAREYSAGCSQIRKTRSVWVDPYSGIADEEAALRGVAAAGTDASDGRAYEDALRSFSAALDQLEGLPAGAGRDRRELDLRIALGPPLMAIRGYSAPEGNSRRRGPCPGRIRRSRAS
ncbi:MAG: hypothetical protein ACREQY_10985, partial [Candidatus Binatia bacterium]